MNEVVVGGIVLCGGLSRRMGRPKAWLPFGPEVLLQRVVGLVGQGIGGGPIVVVAAPGQDLPALPEGVRIARDAVQARGPLQGLATGLQALSESVELAYATATDVPFLEPRWIMRLTALIGQADLAIPFVDGHHQPLAALYRRGPVMRAVAELLAANRMRPFFLTEVVETRLVPADELRAVDPSLKTLRNLNTPADYEAALAEAGFLERE